MKRCACETENEEKNSREREGAGSEIEEATLTTQNATGSEAELNSEVGRERVEGGREKGRVAAWAGSER